MYEDIYFKIHVGNSMYMYACMHAHTHVCMYVCLSVRVYVCVLCLRYVSVYHWYKGGEKLAALFKSSQVCPLLHSDSLLHVRIGFGRHEFRLPYWIRKGRRGQLRWRSSFSWNSSGRREPKWWIRAGELAPRPCRLLYYAFWAAPAKRSASTLEPWRQWGKRWKLYSGLRDRCQVMLGCIHCVVVICIDVGTCLRKQLGLLTYPCM